MRKTFAKLMAGSMIAAATLGLAACHASDNTAAVADTNMTDMNTMDSSAGMANDMSALDATANDANLAVDNAAVDTGNAATTASGNQM